MSALLDSWLYVSRATRTLNACHDVKQIVAVSRQRNASLSLTGALIFSGSHFAQYLEGPATSLEAVASSICNDDRHVRIATLVCRTHSTRRFAEWSLAYAGPSRFVDQEISSAAAEADADSILELLTAFVARPH